MYKPKSLIDGYKVGYGGKMLVAPPEHLFKNNQIEVEFEGEVRTFYKGDALTFRIFPDKFGRIRKTYTLIYFEWHENEKT